jgi:hypothetical protein
MKTMKKLVAALLVLTMVLALTGTAMAGCKFSIHEYVKFTCNAVAYSEPSSRKDTDTIVSKGSIGCVEGVVGNWVRVRLTPYGTDGNFTCPDFGTCWTGWFKAGDLKSSVAAVNGDVLVRFSNGGVGLSKPRYRDTTGFYYFKDEGATRISDDCYRKVKATAKVWLHYTPSLSDSFGKALHKDQKVNYRRRYSFDDRGVMFYGVWKSGKCLWVSSLYTKLVKG